ASTAFKGLTAREKAYAYWIGKASWEGAKICLVQCSPESVPIFSLLQAVFSAQALPTLVSRAEAKGLSEAEIERALIYAAAFYGNMGAHPDPIAAFILVLTTPLCLRRPAQQP
ncbi:MAG: hypothetical protein SGPRY_013678, partial [Prymnesium sp.]